MLIMNKSSIDSVFVSCVNVKFSDSLYSYRVCLEPLHVQICLHKNKCRCIHRVLNGIVFEGNLSNEVTCVGWRKWIL